MTRAGRAWLATVASLTAFVATCFLRLNAAYGPFNVSLHPRDWPSDAMVLWELQRNGQIALGIVLEGLVLGAAAAVVPWIALRRLNRAGGSR